MVVRRRRRQPRSGSGGSNKLANNLDRMMRMILPMLAGQQQRAFQAEQAALGRAHAAEMAEEARAGTQATTMQGVLQQLASNPLTTPEDIQRSANAMEATYGPSPLVNRMRTDPNALLMSEEQRGHHALQEIAGQSNLGAVSNPNLVRSLGQKYNLPISQPAPIPYAPDQRQLTEIGQQLYTAQRNAAKGYLAQTEVESQAATRQAFRLAEAKEQAEAQSKWTDATLRVLEQRAGDNLAAAMAEFNAGNNINLAGIRLAADMADVWSSHERAFELATLRGNLQWDLEKLRIGDRQWRQQVQQQHDRAMFESRQAEAGEWQQWTGKEGGLTEPMHVVLANGQLVELPKGWVGSIQYNRRGTPMNIMSIGALSAATEQDRFSAYDAILQAQYPKPARAGTPWLGPPGADGKPVDLFQMTDAEKADLFKPRELTDGEAAKFYRDGGQVQGALRSDSSSATNKLSDEDFANAAALAEKVYAVDTQHTEIINGIDEHGQPTGRGSRPSIRWRESQRQRKIPETPPNLSPELQAGFDELQAIVAGIRRTPGRPGVSSRGASLDLIRGRARQAQDYRDMIVTPPSIEDLLPGGPYGNMIPFDPTRSRKKRP
jgi:hypothetical protein